MPVLAFYPWLDLTPDSWFPAPIRLGRIQSGGFRSASSYCPRDDETQRSVEEDAIYAQHNEDEGVRHDHVAGKRGGTAQAFIYVTEVIINLPFWPA